MLQCQISKTSYQIVFPLLASSLCMWPSLIKFELMKSAMLNIGSAVCIGDNIVKYIDTKIKIGYQILLKMAKKYKYEYICKSIHGYQY